MKDFRRTATVILGAAAALCSLVPGQVLAAGSYQVYVGYADNLRPSPFFPAPFFGDPTVALFVGQDPNSVQLDAGAVRILNNGAVDITLNGLTASVPGNGWTDPNWNGSIPVAGQVLHPGQNAIFTQTAQFNFDTSDGGYVPININDNCSIGPTAATAICTNNAPFVTPTVDGVATVFRDTGHVLDTGGFDAVNSNPCIGGNNPAGGNTPGNCNESLQWRLIGTTGIQNPGGSTVPEPTSVILLGSGLLGLAGWRLRKSK